MPSILHFQRALTSPPACSLPPGIGLRNYGGDADIDLWLELRCRAFAGEIAPGPAWKRAHFEREFLSQPWWDSTRMWFAHSEKTSSDAPCPRIVGTITLGWRMQENKPQTPFVHWLAVLPEWRRRGVGRLLLAKIEHEAYRAGARSIALETHSAWQSAVAFYEKQCYRRREE